MSFRSICATALAASLFMVTTAAAQDTWRATGNGSIARTLAAVAVLNDGRIVIAGGTSSASGGETFDSVEIHDPVSGLTVAGPTMPFAAYGQSAIKLNDGRIAFVGGFATLPLDTFIILAADGSSWFSAPPIPHPAAVPAVTILPDGRLMVAGTISGGVAAKLVDIYDPATNSWSAGPDMHGEHYAAGYTTLADGRFAVVGGANSTTAEIYDPSTGIWTLTAAMSAPDLGISSAVALDGNRIGFASAQSEVRIYDVAGDTWTDALPPPTVVAYAGALASGSRLMLIGGATDLGSGSADVDITQVYDPATDSWSAGPAMNGTHAIFRPAPAADGRFVIFGSAFSATSTVIENTGPNHAPSANAGADVNGSTCDSCLGGVVVNAGASSDPDGDVLTYEWSLGATVLATSTTPATVLTLPAGTSIVTLTVRDPFGAEDQDTVQIVITNVEDGYRALVASLQGQVAVLTAENAVLEAELAACRAGGGASIAPLMNGYEQHLRAKFRDPRFELPGATSIDELTKLLRVLEKLDTDAQKKIYRALGGRKKHDGHRGRWSPHWDDDCDWDDERR